MSRRKSNRVEYKNSPKPSACTYVELAGVSQTQSNGRHSCHRQTERTKNWTVIKIEFQNVQSRQNSHIADSDRTAVETHQPCQIGRTFACAQGRSKPGN
jgi:hypothetical protein